MIGKVRIVNRYSREQIMEDPNTLYVFGDNLERTGYGGQAGEARGCPNAIGIPTLFAPGRPATPEYISLFRAVAATEFQTLYLHLMSGGDIVWPKDGVGTGLANLQENCPELLFYINNYLKRLTSTFGEVL